MGAALAAAEDAGKTRAPPRMLPRAAIVAGPTCSGKSALAMALAERMGGVVINADSMQVYRELRLVTARPTPDEEARVPHALYGVRPAAEPGSAAWWRGAALDAMTAALAAGRMPILCGGTGLYLRALVAGLAQIPDPGRQAREEARTLLAEFGAEGLHAKLARRDPETASRLRPQDSQRVARAWEVLAGTGRGLASWQGGPGLAPAPWAFRAILLDPPRAPLRAAIRERFDAMVRHGAVEEVAALLSLGLDPSLPAMRAHGVPELRLHLETGAPLGACVDRACAVTGQYTRRQATWFRHQSLVDAEDVRKISSRVASISQLEESGMAELQNFLLGFD